MKHRFTAMAIWIAVCVVVGELATLANAQTCIWRGTAPFCKGQCKSGEIERGRDTDGDGRTCWTGSKVFCCTGLNEVQAEFCKAYSEEAVKAALETEKLGCGYNGPMWSMVADDHYFWCWSFPRDQYEMAGNVHTAARDSLLANCRFCRTYAEKALKAVEESNRLGCRRKGPRWSNVLGEHLSWCIALNGDQTYPNNETSARDSVLANCRFCKTYAEKAVEAATESNKLGCHNEGPRWSNVPGEHFGWCIALNGDEDRPKGEAFAREAKLAYCRRLVH